MTKYDNIPGWPYYHVSRDGKVYSRKSGNWKLLRALKNKIWKMLEKMVN